MKTLLSAILGLGLISGVAFAEEKPATATTPANEPAVTAPATGAEHKEEKTKKTKKHGDKKKNATTDAH